MTYNHEAMLRDRAAGTEGPFMIAKATYSPTLLKWTNSEEQTRICIGLVLSHEIGDTITGEANMNRLRRVPDLEAEVIRLRAELGRTRADNPYVVGWDAGYERAQEEADPARIREAALRDAALTCQNVRIKLARSEMPERACFDYEKGILALIDAPAAGIGEPSK